ncbi:MAG TPA: TRAP transporter substrate-binding protein [Janthinobacterium sp.]|jgi:C4-dicarboxylate-binding protein DctP|nr:TRAP transporter substrate-binding protein [Janthinobacterium sp.]
MKFNKLPAALCAAMALASGLASAQAPIVIKFSHVTTADTPKGMAAQRFKELAEKATKGRVKVEVYPNSQLYKDTEEMEALELDAVQMLAPSLSKFAPLGVKEFEVYDLPYILPSKAALTRVNDGPVGRSLLKKLEPKGITGLAFWDNGFKEMTGDRPMRLPADLKGMKMRIQSSRVLDAQMRALGAIPQELAFSQVYAAMQSGLVDGSENAPSNIYTQKMHEVQKYMTMSDHGYLGYVVVTNKKFWDSLPADIRDELAAAMKEATRYADLIAQQENERALAAIRKSGKMQVYILTAQEKAEWRKALLPVQRAMEEHIGKQLIADFNREAAAAEAGK